MEEWIQIHFQYFDDSDEVTYTHGANVPGGALIRCRTELPPLHGGQPPSEVMESLTFVPGVIVKDGELKKIARLQ